VNALKAITTRTWDWIGRNSYWMQRVTLLADLHLGERVRFFVEGISGAVAGSITAAPAVQEDPINLQFAFMDVVLISPKTTD